MLALQSACSQQGSFGLRLPSAMMWRVDLLSDSERGEATNKSKQPRGSGPPASATKTYRKRASSDTTTKPSETALALSQAAPDIIWGMNDSMVAIGQITCSHDFESITAMVCDQAWL